MTDPRNAIGALIEAIGRAALEASRDPTRDPRQTARELYDAIGALAQIYEFITPHVEQVEEIAQ